MPVCVVVSVSRWFTRFSPAFSAVKPRARRDVTLFTADYPARWPGTTEENAAMAFLASEDAAHFQGSSCLDDGALTR
jgi:hypothetical protein